MRLRHQAIATAILLCGFGWVAAAEAEREAAIAGGVELVREGAGQDRAASPAAADENQPSLARYIMEAPGPQDRAARSVLVKRILLEQPALQDARERSALGAASTSIFDDPEWQKRYLDRVRRQVRAAVVQERAALRSDRETDRDVDVPSAEVLEDAVFRIWNGEPVPADQWRATVGIGVNSGSCCTGTVVGPRLVVTAAHCVRGTNCTDIVQFGNNSRSPEKKIRVQAAYSHGKYGTTRGYDMAFLVLQEPVTDLIPAGQRPGLVTPEVFANASAVRLVGFGLTEQGRSGIKNQVEVPIVSHDCRGGDGSKYGCGADIEFVAGGFGLDTCNGDSGGTVQIEAVQSGKSLLYLAGITSRATANATSNCGDGGVYARMDAFEKWLTDNFATVNTQLNLTGADQVRLWTPEERGVTGSGEGEEPSDEQEKIQKVKGMLQDLSKQMEDTADSIHKLFP